MPVYSGAHGVIKIGLRTASGWPGAMRDIGDVDPDKGIDLSPKTDTFDVKTLRGGHLVTKDRLIKERSSTVKFSMQEFNAMNLAMQLFGMDSVVAEGTVTGEPLPNPLVAGDEVVLRNPLVSTLVLTDSASGTPATLTDTHFSQSAEQAAYGGLTIKSVAGLTLPILADYAYAERIQVPILNGDLESVWVTIELMNSAQAGAKMRIDLYKVQFDAAKTLNLLQAKGISTPEMEGMLLTDLDKEADPVLGQFGRVMFL